MCFYSPFTVRAISCIVALLPITNNLDGLLDCQSLTSQGVIDQHSGLLKRQCRRLFLSLKRNDNRK